MPDRQQTASTHPGWPVQATVNYVGPMTERGYLPTRDLGTSNLTFNPVSVLIRDGRAVAGGLDLDEQGFTLVKHRSAVCRSQDRETLDRLYHAEMIALLRELTGARDVLPDRRGMVLRFAEASGVKGARPATWAHMDYTETSALQFRDLVPQWEHADLAPYSRFAIYQTWRVTSDPPHDSQLAVTDGRTVPDGDWRIFDSARPPIELPGNVWESRIGQANPAHEWYSFPRMTADDLLVFKGYDSRAGANRNVLHTAFEDPAAGPAAAHRTSIETRYCAYFA